jgi:hypothetical protein
VERWGFQELLQVLQDLLLWAAEGWQQVVLEWRVGPSQEVPCLAAERAFPVLVQLVLQDSRRIEVDWQPDVPAWRVEVVRVQFLQQPGGQDLLVQPFLRAHVLLIQNI